MHAESGDTAPPTPPPRARPSQPLPLDAAILRRPPPATSPPRPATTGSQGAPQPTRHTSLHHTITYTTTTSPYHRIRPRRGTTHNQHPLNTTTTQSSTTYRPHYTGSRRMDHRTPPWTCGEPRKQTGNTRA